MNSDFKIRRLFLQLFGLIVVLLIVIALFVIIVDPYQQYRPSDKYIANQRLEIGGIAKNHDYDAVITGSSMSMNHYPEQADSLWGWKTRNFSIMGATYIDYEVILPYIISQGKVKNIILDLDFFSFALNRFVVDKYLYDNSIWNDYEYLYNYTTLKNCFIKIFQPVDVKNLYHFNSPVGRSALRKSFQDATSGNEYVKGYDYMEMKQNFDDSILKILNDMMHRGEVINWYIYFPPYSIGEFIVIEKSGYLRQVLLFKQYMVEQLSTFPNIRIYDFQCEPWITDLDEYMDLRHHSHYYNREIIEAIHRDGNRIFPDSVISRNRRLIELIPQYTDSISVL